MLRLPLSRSVVALVSAAMAASGIAADRRLPDRLQIGADVEGGRCTAVVTWDPKAGVVLRDLQALPIQCGGSAQIRGRIQRRAVASIPTGCGEESRRTLAPLGQITIRRCRDANGVEVIAIDTPLWAGYAELGVAVPLVRGIAMAAAGHQIELASLPTIDPAVVTALTPAPARREANIAAGATRADALSQVSVGLQNIYAGRNVDASHFLNDAISAQASAPTAQRAQLRLVAALADSNIGAFADADGHLRAAAALIASMPASPEQGRLASQLPIYRALHLVNQGEWAAARDQLQTRQAAGAGLRDMAVLARLNDVDRPGLPRQFDPGVANTLILEVQGDVALSTALLKLGQVEHGQRPLEQGVAVTLSLESLLAQYTPGSVGSINWLRARLERQHGRLLAALGDRDAALASFDCAIADLRAVAAPRGGACLFPAAQNRGLPLDGPTLADAQLERAVILEGRRGTSSAVAIRAYEDAVDTLSGSPEGAASASPLLAHYLDLLLAAGDPGSAEKFFRALQTVREPAVARQYAALQQAVATPGDADRRRRINEAEAVYQSLGAQIAALRDGDPAIAALQAKRDQASADLAGARSVIVPNSRSAGLDDAPVTLSQLQTSLREQEAYWRLARVGGRLFGVVVTNERSMPYAVAPSATSIAATARAVIASARLQQDKAGNQGLRPFAVGRAHDLFAAVAGPAADLLLQTQRIAVDDADSLGGVPAAILVTAATARPVNDDYSRVPFLGRSAELATSLSPRAFLRARVGDTSAAPHRLIGFGNNAKAPAGPATATVVPTFGCTIPYPVWSVQYNRNDGVPVTEISAAAAAIGDPSAPIISGAAFTDMDLRRRSDAGELARYQVVHFATHGSTSIAVPSCDVPLPPALLTSIEAPTAAPGPSPSTGWFSYIDIARLRLDANVVVLAACDTTSGENGTLGRLGGQAESGSQLDGLIRSFLLAHARAVVATYWEVPIDQGTQPLIEAFYKAGRTHSLGAALHEGQVEVLSRAETSHPFYWAAFFLVGDGAKPMFSGPIALAAR